MKKISRRDFLKISGSAAAALPITSLLTSHLIEDDGELALLKEKYLTTTDDPFEVKDDYTPHHQTDVVFTAAFMGQKPGADVLQKGMFGRFFTNAGVDETKPGFTMLDQAVRRASGSVYSALCPGGGAGFANAGHYAWANSLPILESPYQFASEEEASIAIKNSAKIMGADLVGITVRDKRWDYSGFVNPQTQESFDWSALPFEPKTVIVLGFEMDYEMTRHSPTYLSGSMVQEGYSKAAKTAYQVADFLKELGYHAIPTVNDTGLNIPYAIMAGLGEKSRMGMVISPEYGPRFRTSKVYTDFDFVSLDKPIEFGVEKFCTKCQKCADACPVEAISTSEEPEWEREFSHGYDWFSNKGTKKWYQDAYACFNYWIELGSGCNNCLAACPYNKPDFWHHNLVELVTSKSPSFMQEFMRQMDDSFGFGESGVDSPKVQKAAEEFWQTEWKGN